MLNNLLIEEHIKNALKEDIGFEDISTEALISADKIVTAYLKTRDDGVFCGTQIFEKVYKLLSDKAEVKFHKQDGDEIKKGECSGGILSVTKEVVRLLSSDFAWKETE